MSSGQIIVGLDIGTTKICVLVGELSGKDRIRVIGVGIEPAQGMHKGMINDVALAAKAVTAARQAAERSSGYEISRAYVSVAGKQIVSVNSHGVTGLNSSRSISAADIERALEAAQAEIQRHGREVLHVIPRTFTLDDRPDIRNPIGMFAYRMEVEAHIVAAATPSLLSLRKCIQDAGIAADRFVLNQLASAEIALTDAERESGVVIIDIGGGTTDLAVFIDDAVWHTAVIEVGGNHITNDIAHVLHLPLDEAERIKIDNGNADPGEVDPDQLVRVEPFGESRSRQLLAHDLAQIIEARVDEIFTLVVQEIKRSGYDGLLPAGVVLTGGTAALRNISKIASRVMNLPARIARPENITGLVDRLHSPAFSTGVGLLRYAYRPAGEGESGSARRGRGKGEGPDIGKAIGDFLGRLLPD